MTSDASSADAEVPSDAALAAGVRRGVAAAFAALVGRHYPTSLRYAVRFLGHREDAEDAVQETWLRVYRALGSGAYREQAVFERWLFRILLNVCRTAAASRRRRDAGRTPVPDIDLAPVAADAGGGGPVGEPMMDALLATLDPRTREALLLKHGLGLDYPEMARRTGDSVSALKMRVKRGLEALRSRVLEGDDR